MLCFYIPERVIQQLLNNTSIAKQIYGLYHNPKSSNQNFIKADSALISAIHAQPIRGLSRKWVVNMLIPSLTPDFRGKPAWKTRLSPDPFACILFQKTAFPFFGFTSKPFASISARKLLPISLIWNPWKTRKVGLSTNTVIIQIHKNCS